MAAEDTGTARGFIYGRPSLYCNPRKAAGDSQVWLITNNAAMDIHVELVNIRFHFSGLNAQERDCWAIWYVHV